MAQVPQVFRQCSNCGEPILGLNLSIHEAHCLRNFTQCIQCGEKVRIDKAQEHRSVATGDWVTVTAALVAGDLARVRRAVAHSEGEAVRWRGEQAETLLHLAVEHHASLVGDLLAQGSEADAQDARGMTPLHLACASGGTRLAVVERLLQAGAKPQLRTLAGQTPFALATNEEVRLLLLSATEHSAGPPLSSAASPPEADLRRLQISPEADERMRPQPPAQAKPSRHVQRLRSQVVAAGGVDAGPEEPAPPARRPLRRGGSGVVL
jgi:hypothetical protein